MAGEAAALRRAIRKFEIARGVWVDEAADAVRYAPKCFSAWKMP